jgi:CO/xanthine dehydrogenase Mo-binding subunit
MESLTSASAAICYARLREEQTKARAEGRLVGIGIATYAELTGIGSRISAAPGMPINTGTESATIRLDSTGAVTGSFGIASHGQGLETTLAQVIADELGPGSRISGSCMGTAPSLRTAPGPMQAAAQSWLAERPRWRRGCSRKK